MSDQDERSPGFRRIGRKDRKRRLDPRGPLFPPGFEDEPLDDELPSDEDAFEEEVAGSPMRPVQAAPPAERFPPLKPGAERRDAQANVPASAPRRGRTCLPNLVAALFLLGTVALIVVYAIIFMNPYTPLNPFPPFTPIPIIITTTFLPPTTTPSPTPGPTATFTPLPAEALPTRAPFPFVIANDGAVYIRNANEQGCNWSSIAGTATDLSGAPLDGLGIRVTGDRLDETVFTGGAQTYGPGGFELFLNGAPQAATYTVQLLSAAGLPISPEVSVTTRATCEQNVAVVSFVQVRAI